MSAILRTFKKQSDVQVLFDAAVKALGSLQHEVINTRTVTLPNGTTHPLVEFKAKGSGGGKKMILWITDSAGQPPLIVAVNRSGFGGKSKVPKVAEEIFKSMDVILA